MIISTRKKSACRIILFIFIFLSLSTRIAFSIEDLEFPEAKIKIAYLINFMRFVEWPEESSLNKQICIIGYKREYHDVIKTLSNQSVGNNDFVIKEYSDKEELQDLRSCRIIFITSNANHRQKIVAHTIRGENILTVGESDGFAQHGGMINFIDRNHTIRFEINLDAINETDLIVTSKILRIADRVIRKTDD